jgi:DNA polymerase-3 subunit delta'
MLFPDVIAQADTRQHLLDLVAHNRLSHALLLVGKEGSGILPLAVNFGQYVVSQPSEKAAAPPPDLFGAAPTDLFGEPAAAPAPLALQGEGREGEGIDPLAAQLLHPDLHFSFPVLARKPGDKPTANDYIAEFREFFKLYPYGNGFDWLQYIKAENRQGNITAEECNDIIRKLSLKTFKARYKVLVMWLPEYLGKEGNKLLKLIEEPPPDTLFILASEDENAILPTILSRCQTIRVPPLAEADIADALVSRCGADQATAMQLALVADGNYHEALQLYQHNDEDLNGLLRDWLNAALLKGPKQHERFDKQIQFADAVSRLGRERQKQLLRYFIQLIEQSIRLRLIGEDKLHLPPAEKDFAQRLNKFSGLGQQKAMADELERAVYYIERNANAKMLFQALTLKLRYIVLDKLVLERAS